MNRSELSYVQPFLFLFPIKWLGTVHLTGCRQLSLNLNPSITVLDVGEYRCRVCRRDMSRDGELPCRTRNVLQRDTLPALFLC